LKDCEGSGNRRLIKKRDARGESKFKKSRDWKMLRNSKKGRGIRTLGEVGSPSEVEKEGPQIKVELGPKRAKKESEAPECKGFRPLKRR